MKIKNLVNTHLMYISVFQPVLVDVFSDGGAENEIRAAGADVVGGEGLTEGNKKW